MKKLSTSLFYFLFLTAPVSVTAQQVSATIVNVVDVKCFGDCNGSATASVTGGTTPYTYTWTSGQKTFTASGLCAGNYTFTVRDAGGDTYQVGVAINSPTQLNLASSSSNATCGSCPDGSASATASGGTSAYTYSWSNGSGLQSPTGLIPGVYTVCVTDKNGCTACKSVTVSFTSGIQKQEKQALSVMPNPGSGIIFVEIESGKWKAEIVNLLGETVHASNEEITGPGRKQLDIAVLPKGIYLLSLSQGDKVRTARIIKE